MQGRIREIKRNSFRFKLSQVITKMIEKYKLNPI